MRKPKKVIYIQGSGDSKQLNTNPWKSKDLQYRYTNENYRDDLVVGNSVSLKAANFARDCRESAKKGRQARINKENRELNNLARSSFDTVPVLRALARFSDLLKGTARENVVVRYDVNPLLQYERTLLECAKLWDIAGGGEEMSFVFNAKFHEGVGIEYGKKSFFTHSGDNQGINAGLYRTDYLELKRMERALAEFSGLLADNTLLHLSSAETALFVKAFINNIHSFSRHGVEVGIYANMIEDALVSNDEYLRNVGILLDKCYTYSTDAKLAVAETLPKYNLLKADEFLKNYHDTVVAPTFDKYLSEYFKHYEEHQATGLYSEIFERMGEIKLLDDDSISAKRLVSSVVVLDAKIERIEVLLRSYLYALAQSVTNPKTISKMVTPALAQLKSKVNIDELVSRLDSKLGANFEYVGRNLKSMNAAYQ